MRNFIGRQLRIVLVMCSLLFVLSSIVAAQGTYTITDLGTLNPTDQFSQGFGINNYGQVGGFVLTTSASVRGFLWTPNVPNGTTGSMIDLGPARSGVGGAFKVNDYGQVLLNVPVPTAFGIQNQAHLWTPLVPNGTTGSLVSIGGLTGPDGVSNGTAINSYGQVAGFGYPGPCFLWTPDFPNVPTGSFNSYFNGTTTEPGYGYSSQGGNANGVNDSGIVTGSMQAGFYGFPSIHVDPGFHYTQADIISPSYDPASQDYSGSGNAINGAGHVAGTVIFPGIFQLRPFFYDGVTMTDISPGGGGNANAINSLDQIVGTTSSREAFIYSGGLSTLLSALIDPGTGWVLSDASGINDFGQIVGSGSINGQSHAFLLTPR